MILLHRLSCLLFEAAQDKDKSRVKDFFANTFVITPNENFSLFIEGLSEKLDIEEIKKYTVEKFYNYLLHECLNKAHIYYDKFKYGDEQENSGNMLSEKSMNGDMLKYFYSPDFVSRLSSIYESKNGETLAGLSKQKVNEGAQRFGKL